MESTEDRLLQAAREVFEEEGFRGATTRRIAARAGVNEVTLFRHFASKEELIAAALERRHAAALERLAAVRLPEEPGDLEVELSGYLTAVLYGFIGAGRGVRTALAEWEHLPAYHRWLLGPSDEVMTELERYLGRAAAGGRIRGAEVPRTAMQVLTATVFAAGMLSPMLPGHFPEGPDETVRAAVRLVLDGLRTTGEPPGPAASTASTKGAHG